MDISFSSNARQWMQVAGVNEDIVRAVLHAPTSQSRESVAGRRVHRAYKWISDELIVHVTTVASSLQAQPEVVEVIRTTSDGPLHGMVKGMDCDHFEDRVVDALGKELTPSEMEQRSLGDLTFKGEPAVFAGNNSPSRHPRPCFVITISSYAAALRKSLDSVLRLPLVEKALAENRQGATAGDSIRQMCREFESLLNDRDTKELNIQKWLEESRHQLFLDPTAQEIRPQVPFGDSVSDFVIVTGDSRYILVEIESAHHTLFTMRGEPRAAVNHARQQVMDWQGYIRDNIQTVRNEQNMPGIDRPKGWVIIGRSHAAYSDIRGTKNKKKARRTWSDLKSRDPTLCTYDDLLTRANHLANTIDLAMQKR